MEMRILSKDDLRDELAVLHDAVFTLGSVKFVSETGDFVLKCWAVERGEEKPRWHWRAYTLTFHGVLECWIDKTEDVSHYEFSTITYSESDCIAELITHYALGIRLKMTRLDGLLERMEETRESLKRSRFPWTHSWDNLD